MTTHPPPRRPNRTGSSANVVLIVLVLALSGILVFQIVAGGGDGGVRTVTPRGELAPIEKSQIDLFKAAAPSVVHITSLEVQDNGLFDPVLVPKGTGSGIIWDRQGHIVTNYHVISGTRRRWTVILQDQTQAEARLVGRAPHSDIAVLKIEVPKSKLRPIAIGESNDLQVGQSAYAIGSPYSLDQTFSTGVISGLGRTITSVTNRKIRDVIQTDAAINPGNSGGPLLDSAGRLIGVNTAIVSPSGAYAGIGFAVPVDRVRRVVPQLIRFGKVIRPGLGITIYPDETTARLRRAGVFRSGGVLVRQVIAGGAAANAGIRPTRVTGRENQLGDLIVAIEGTPIRESQDLFDTLEKQKIGETINVTVVRGNTRKNIRVTLKAL
ncbi:MAG: S1C family serine protease [Planctomycetaceae bacterium]